MSSNTPFIERESKRERKRRIAEEHNAQRELRSALRRVENALAVRGASMKPEKREHLEKLHAEIKSRLQSPADLTSRHALLPLPHTLKSRP